jgi:amino acid transporter
MLTSFNTIYSFIIKATVIGFGVLFTSLCCVFVYFTWNTLQWYIPFFIFALIVSTLVGSYLFVVLSIPFELPKKFDVIKNKVAMGGYVSLQEFQEEVADFMLSFFNFQGADIIGGKFHFTGCTATQKECGVDFSQLSADSFSKIKKRIDARHKAFHIPIILGGENLGYMILITRGYTIPIFYSLIQDFENYYLDDQIKHFVK